MGGFLGASVNFRNAPKIVLRLPSFWKKMAFKLLIFTAFVATAQAGTIGYATSPGLGGAYEYQPHAAKVYQPAPISYSPAGKVETEPEHYNTNPQYSFKYDVQDELTGDSKSQQESREGDVVRGSYSVVDADGTKRTVEYTADPEHGFNAVVHREPANVKPVANVAYQAAPVHSYYQ